MKKRTILIVLLVGLFSSEKVYSQSEKNLVDYKVIAEGTDAPIPELQIVCFNKFFNKDYLPIEFQKKYNLTDKNLYKNKMLIEIFHSDNLNQGLDKIDLIGILENDSEFIIEYNVVNSDSENDEKQLSPFLIVQVLKSKKKIKFKANGIELGKETEIFVD